jgi:hypothetical protein
MDTTFCSTERSATGNPLGERWHGRLKYVASKPKDSLWLHAIVTRPDGIVALAAGAAQDLPVAFEEIVRWFGAPL